MSNQTFAYSWEELLKKSFLAIIYRSFSKVLLMLIRTEIDGLISVLAFEFFVRLEVTFEVIKNLGAVVVRYKNQRKTYYGTIHIVSC